ncbi:DUF3617 domain-containing protein [Parerythrobacter aestuarii]|uniref:DUF3617 domain-containing protein n=1 Tax=Parerythrobacter aestuarii TaxID=3020909 RepID=UPI0024DE8E45|nr:DUF3617 domain-containing protein [Parerythrobacter aestuarii]
MRSDVRIACVTLAAFCAVSCGQEKPLSGEEVLAQAGKLQKPEPGLYATSTKLVSFDVPGLPPAQADRMREQMQGLSSEPQPSCLTEAEASKGFEDVLRQIGEGINDQECAFTRFNVDGIRFDANLSCSGPMGVSAEVGLSGTSTSAGFDASMDLEASNSMIPGGSMEMQFDVKSDRLGPCSEAELDGAEAQVAEE